MVGMEHKRRTKKAKDKSTRGKERKYRGMTIGRKVKEIREEGEKVIKGNRYR